MRVAADGVSSAPNMTATYNPATNRPDNGNYDANGNAPIGSWSVENRLLSQTLDGVAINWGYDTSGQRVMRYETFPAQVYSPGLEDYVTVQLPKWTFTLYDAMGRRIETIVCAAYGPGYNQNYQLVYGLSCTLTGAQVYFGSRLIARDQKWVQSQYWDDENQVYVPWLYQTAITPVVTDRLGSVRAYKNPNGTWTKLSYYGYGEEKTPVTADGKDKYATYLRDSSTGLGQDYAMQRYYSEGLGRFYSPDKGGVRAAIPKDPGSWNRYSYTQGDPINFADPPGTQRRIVSQWKHGCYGYPDDGGIKCEYWVEYGIQDDGEEGVGGPGVPDPPEGGGGGGSIIDSSTNQNARALLQTRLSGFKDSNCWKVLNHEGVNAQNILDNYSNENFYDVRQGSAYAGLTLSQIGIPSSSTNTLNSTLGSADAMTVGTLGSSSTTAVLVGTQYFFSGNTDTLRMNSLLHEMLHALGGFDDAQILGNAYFLANGLVNKSAGGLLDTSGISDWLSRDCNK